MKAAVVQSVGASWEIKDVPTPEPSAKQVLINVNAIGVFHTDAFITEGKHPAAITFPRSSLTESSQYSRGAKNKE
jgi:D-arabinose 1-dehydrogenase-like Zn-dependent alcohol dehydrogenase